VTQYYEALKRAAQEEPVGEYAEPVVHRSTNGTVAIGAATSQLPVPTIQELPESLARAAGIQRLSERLAPLAVFDTPVRLLVTGCRSGDGVSTVAIALALDLSQRLSLKTMLVDANVRHPSLDRFLAVNGRVSGEPCVEEQVRIRSSGRPRLDLATCRLGSDGSNAKELLNDFDSHAFGYPAVVIDLGVTRLDARMLPLARSSDPILLIIRYGRTERQELATTVSALRAANRAVAGVILNGTVDPVAKLIRRFINP
jgi:Mrp family chromosome partitioning ATPase